MTPICPNCQTEIITHVVPSTARQAEVLRYLIEFQQRRGHVPSYSQIARHIGVKSRATIAKHVRALRRQGLLKDAEASPELSLETTTVKSHGAVSALT